MSFILDALKKAESERNRNSGPVLMDVRVAPPRRRLPTWAWVLGGVLLANLGVLAWLLLRPATPPHEVAITVAPALPAAAPPAAAAPTPTPAPAATPLPPPALEASQPGSNILPPVNAVAAPNVENLPMAQDLLAAGVQLPPLQLNLHVYNANPAHRYVLLNGLRLSEGEFTPNGVKVELITAQGVVLDAGGRRFRLPAGG